MSSTTTNFGLHKIDLNDAPPDITVLNQNCDTIDEELSSIGETVEEALGNLTPEKIGASPSGHTHTAEQVGALPLTGGALSGNTLGIYNGKAVVLGDNLGASLIANTVDDASDLNNIRNLRVTNSGNLPRAIFLRDVISGNRTDYNIFGEHNITKGTTDIGAGSALATGCIHLVYE